MKRVFESVLSVLAALAVVVACTLAAAPADAQSRRNDRKEARERFERGVELYESGDVRAAMIEFKRAYRAMPNFHLLYNIAQAAAELHEWVEAYDYYLQYLGEGGSKIDPRRRREVKQEIRRLEGFLATVRIVVSEPGAEVTIDGNLVGISPMRQGVVVSAGRRRIVVTRAGFAPWERRIDLPGRVTETVRVELASLAGPGGGAPLRSPRGERDEAPGDPAVWTAAAVTTALAVGTGFAAVRTVRARDEYDVQLATVPNTRANLDAAGDDVRRYALLTDVGLGLTAVGVIATILLARRGPDDPDPGGGRVSVQLGPEQVAVMGTWRY